MFLSYLKLHGLAFAGCCDIHVRGYLFIKDI